MLKKVFVTSSTLVFGMTTFIVWERMSPFCFPSASRKDDVYAAERAVFGMWQAVQRPTPLGRSIGTSMFARRIMCPRIAVSTAAEEPPSATAWTSAVVIPEKSPEAAWHARHSVSFSSFVPVTFVTPPSLTVVATMCRFAAECGEWHPKHGTSDGLSAAWGPCPMSMYCWWWLLDAV